MTRRLRRDDEGATLIIAMFIVTAVALVVGAVLGQADSGIQSTVALRDQAGSSYNGDGAAQVAINTLRKSTFDDPASSCFGASGTLTLNSFYAATGGQNGTAKSSAAVTCTAEAGTGSQGAPVQISSANKPGQAVLTLGTAVADTQFWGQSNKTINVHGAVTSDSGIDGTSGPLNVTGGVAVKAVGACSGTVPACTPIASPGVLDPNYPAPSTTPAPPSSLPTCNNTTKNQVVVFNPGLYTSADLFNTCDQNSAWIRLMPGTYYLDFTTGSHVWSPSGTIVGGNLTAAQTNTPPSVPGACVNPIKSTSAVGVQLVFGGDSQLAFAKGAKAEFCATYSATNIPTVFYGLKANVGSGANTVHAQSGCVVTVGVGGCDVVSDGGNGTKPAFFFEGFVYTPLSRLTLAVNNSGQPYFNFGIVSRSLTMTSTGSAGSNAFINLPDDSPGIGTARLIVDLNVYVCPGASTCSTSGKKALTARVMINDPSGTPVANNREITVLGWSETR